MIDDLIRGLDTDDLREQRRVSRELLAIGAPATPALIEALTSGPPRTRKAAAYLLGHGRSDASGPVAALSLAVVGDPEPKVRQNAAVSLGRLQARTVGEALAEALAREEVDYVRHSLILALGAVGGDAARAALTAWSPRNAREEEALRKARDRVLDEHPTATWRPDATYRPEVLLEVPPGLERIAAEEAEEHGLPLPFSYDPPLQPLNPTSPSLLHCSPDVAPWNVPPELRCIHGLRLPGGDGPSFDPSRPEEAAAAVTDLLSGSPLLRHWRDWLQTDEALLPYRFVLDAPHVRRDHLRALLAAVRAAARPLGLIDRPSHYLVELHVTPTTLSLRPTFVPDTRFAYRVKDVGAALNPVVAAGLARLVRTADAKRIFDPVCGSGTLLIERALLDTGSEKASPRLRGLDVSPTAVSAARINVQAAGLQERIRIARGDATARESWPACDEVLANLPYGLRTRRPEMDLGRLYAAILANFAASLRPGGRAVLVSANRKAFRPALAAQEPALHVADHLRVASGGLWLDVWVLTKEAPSS